MNYGRFFELDLDSSRIEEGVSVFNYIDLSDAFSKKEKQMTPEYPIFVTVTSSSVKFILQYCVYKYDNKISRYYPSERINEFSVIHMEEVILELPLSMTSGQSLSSIVKRIYSTPFPVQAKGDDINYIEELIKSRYNNGGDKLHYKVRQHDRLKERDKRIVSYSSLYVWGLYENGKYELFDKSDNNKCNKFLRKIFLDFLFDMIHSDVFKNTVHYEAVYEVLMSDFFCSSIIRKSEYYYQRAIVNGRIKDASGEKTDFRNASEIYATYFDKAELDWVECIQAQQSDKHFESVASWYKYLSLGGRIKKWIYSSLVAVLDFLFPLFYIQEKSWFVSPEKELQRVYFRLFGIKSFDREVRNSLHFSKKLSWIFWIWKSGDIQGRQNKASLWFFKRYDFADAFRLSFFPFANTAIFILLFAISGCALFRSSEFILQLERLLNSSVCNFNICWYIVIGLLVFAIISKHIHFLFPRLVSSITAAWLTVAFSEDLYKAFFDSQWSGWSIGLIIALILLFIYYEVDKIVSKVGTVVKLFRSFQMLLTSFIISLAVGIIVINFTGERILLRSGILPAFYRDNVLLDKKSLDDKLVINLDSQSICEDDCISLVHSYTYGMPIKPSPIEINETDESGNVVTKYVIPAQPSRKDTLAQLNAFMQVFAGTDYEREYTARIKEARDSVVRMETFEHIHSDSLLLGHFLMRHEDSRMFKDLLDKVVHSDNNQKLATFIEVGNNGYKFFILYDFLIQFAVVAMFIGIFIQMIFEEKNITEL